MGIKVHKLHSDFLKGSLCQKLSFYFSQIFMRIFICLFNQRKQQPLGLIQFCPYSKGFFQLLQSQYKYLSIVFVIYTRKRNVLELDILQPLNKSLINQAGIIRLNKRALLQVPFLSLCFLLKVKPCQSSYVLLAYGFVYHFSFFDFLSNLHCL